jgi:hypothetical protein
MNDFFLRSARRGRIGLMDRLADGIAEDRRDAMHAATADIELAIKHGDDLGREMAEARLDAILDRARAERQTPQTPEPPTTSFDGGFRGRRTVAPAAGLARSETAGQLFQRALRQSLDERAERGDDERVIVANT